MVRCPDSQLQGLETSVQAAKYSEVEDFDDSLFLATEWKFVDS